MRRALLIAPVIATAACSEGGQLVIRTVSDQTGVAVAGVRVQVEDQPWATTGADGEAIFEGVSGEFTVELQTAHRAPAGHANEARILRRRTGPEVVAEISSTAGVGDWHYGVASGTVSGRTATSSTAVVQIGFTPFKDWSAATAAEDDGSFSAGVGWKGPADVSSATMTLRAWESDGANPPGRYYGFGQSGGLEFLEQDEVTEISLSLDPVEEHTVEGVVSPPGASTSAPILSVLWLAFSAYEQLRLGDAETVGPGGFAWAVPSIAGAEAWIGVWNGARWHKRRVDVPASSSALDFAPPASPQLLEPAAGGNGDSATVFRWAPPEAGGSSMMHVACNWIDGAGESSFATYFVDADGAETTLPAVPGIVVVPGAMCSWGVKWCAATDAGVEERCAWSESRDIMY